MTRILDTIWKKFTLADDRIEFEEYQTTWLLRLTRRIREAVILVFIKVPPLYEAFILQNNEKIYLRIAIQFLFGVFLGFVFYRVILVDLQLDPVSTKLLAIIISLSLGIGNAISSQIRCISLLLPIRFGSTTGRAVISALIITYITAGPITNITTNLRESVRVIICQMGTTFDLTKTKYDLIFKPLGEAFVKIRGDTGEAKNIVSSVDEAIKPIEKEVEDEEETKRLKEENDYVDKELGETARSQDIDNKLKILQTDNYGQQSEKKYVKKLKYRCEQMKSAALKGCEKSFDVMFNRCFDNLIIVVNWICYVFRLSFVCNLFSLFGGSDMCNVEQVVPVDFGATYEFLHNSRERLKTDLGDFHFRYNVIQIPPEAREAMTDMYGASKNIIHEFNEKRSAIDLFVIIIMRCTAFSFIFVIIGCNNYIFNYLNDVDEDNRYVTLYFRQIDYRRFVRGKFTLLPLKSSEKRELSDVYQLHLTNEERAEMWHSLISTAILFIFTLLFTIIDEFLYTLLRDLRTYGYIEYTQIGHHDLSVEVRGVGFLASVLRSLVHDFHIKRKIKRVVSNKDCLPNPSIPGKYNFKIFGSFLLLFLLTILNAWIFRRLKRYVCSVFFPKAEKTRILYLYNQRLRKRITYLNYRLDIVQEEAKKDTKDPLTFYTVLRIKHPKLFGWLGYLGASRRKCVICGEEEQKSGAESHCANINCYFYYCQQCWDFVVRQKCIGCPRYKV